MGGEPPGDLTRHEKNLLAKRDETPSVRGEYPTAITIVKCAE